MKIKKEISLHHLIILSMFIVYVILRVYTSYTVNPEDDKIADRFRDILLRVAFIEPSSDSDV